MHLTSVAEALPRSELRSAGPQQSSPSAQPPDKRPVVGNKAKALLRSRMRNTTNSRACEFVVRARDVRPEANPRAHY